MNPPGRARREGNDGGRAMKFNFLVIFGVLLVVLGLAALLDPDIKMPAKREELQIGGLKVPVETRRIMTVPPLLAA